MDEHKDFELIGRFLDFDLTQEELAQFEKRMEEDPILQERFTLFQAMGEQVDQSFPTEEIGQVKSGMQSQLVAVRETPSAKIRKLSIVKIASIAAGIAILLIASFLWINRSTTVYSNLAVAAHYWDATDKDHLFDSMERSEGDPADPKVKARTFFRSIQDLYTTAQYPIVIDQLEIYTTTTPPPIPFEEDANWLLALAYLAIDDVNRAVQQLEEMNNKFPGQKDRTLPLLEVLKQMKEEGSVRVSK